ncbi:MAG: type II toxin-antitoxin system prevent-host-death family antitoxin [Gammaproteobacteria bacterium]|nr:type II toxin-antitoxin system prevent-host-death family antitoxin [Gammaproteobacteria bacterium]MCY4281361.1 type II toxin-antitoxin system prevent-host-death family antitoxin [Gammaproteobacteria bacterium]
MKEIGSYDAKTNLPELLRRVESGEEFTITNRGKPIADLVPSRASALLKAQTAIANILQSKKYPMDDKTLSDLREIGRK